MKIWMRLGVTLNVPDGIGMEILDGDKDNLLYVLRFGMYKIDGDSYIPAEIACELGYPNEDVEFDL